MLGLWQQLASPYKAFQASQPTTCMQARAARSAKLSTRPARGKQPHLNQQEMGALVARRECEVHRLAVCNQLCCVALGQRHLCRDWMGAWGQRSAVDAIAVGTGDYGGRGEAAAARQAALHIQWPHMQRTRFQKVAALMLSPVSLVLTVMLPSMHTR